MRPDEQHSLPSHVAVIMDGNGRWARERGLPRIEGHRAGAETVRRVLRACRDLGIEYLTLYAFSTENWLRPPAEVRQLMQLLRLYLDDHLRDLQEQNVRLNVIGRLDRLPRGARSAVARAIDATRHNTAGVLTLALSYGSRDELVRAARNLAGLVRDGALDPDDITEELLEGKLDTAGLPDPDLVIRTSGEFRLSNFLLWQSSYAEFWVTGTYWPDFTAGEFAAAVAEYGRRSRRFGGVGDA